MRITGGRRLRRQLSELPERTRDHITRAIQRNVRQGVRVAKVLAPVDSGQTKEDIEGFLPATGGGLVGVVEVIASNAPRTEKDRAYSIEHGRKQGKHGTTEGAHHMRRTRQYLGKKFKASIKAAIRKAAREVTSG